MSNIDADAVTKAIEQFSVDADLAHIFVQGGDEETVVLGNVETPTLRKLAKDIGKQSLDQVLAQGVEEISAIKNQTQTLYEQTEDVLPQIEVAKNAAVESAIASIEAKENESLSAMQQEGTAQVGAITTEGNTQTERVQTEGEKQLASLAGATKNLGSFPGTVYMFTGSFGGSDGKRAIPLGGTEADEKKVLCDGTNGTPDLQDTFIRGGDGTNTGTEGGDIVTEGHTLTISEMAAHTHGIGTKGYFATGHISEPRYPSSSTSILSSSTGGSQAHAHNQNLPPYYTLAYYMQLA